METLESWAFPLIYIKGKTYFPVRISQDHLKLIVWRSQDSVKSRVKLLQIGGSKLILRLTHFLEISINWGVKG